MHTTRQPLKRVALADARRRRPALSGLPVLRQEFLQHEDSLVDVLLLQQKWRQEAYDSILGTVEQNSLGERRIHNRTRGHVQLNPLDEPPSSYFLCRRSLLDERLQLLLQVRAYLVHALQQFFFLDDGEEFQRHTAGQRPSAKSRTMLAGRDRRSKFFLGEKRTQRKHGGNRLGNCDNIRSHAKTLKRKHRPSPP